MKTKVPFAGRCIVIAAVMAVISSLATVRLVNLQLLDKENISNLAADDLIDRERIPARRGIIMDRNEELLTNNIQSAELVADYNHLREITAVVEGLAYNHAINDPRWDSITDPKEQRKLIYNYRAKLLSNAKATPEEKEERRKQIDPKDANANRLLEFSEATMKHYFEQHDKLVAAILHPFLSHQKIEVTVNGHTTERFMTREDIIEKIAQTATEKYNEEAKKKRAPHPAHYQEHQAGQGYVL